MRPVIRFQGNKVWVHDLDEDKPVKTVRSEAEGQRLCEQLKKQES